GVRGRLPGLILVEDVSAGMQSVAVRVEALVEVRPPAHGRVRDPPERVREPERAPRDGERDHEARGEEREMPDHAADTLSRPDDELVEHPGETLDVRAERAVLQQR